MPLVPCEVSDGLRPSEATVCVKDVHGRPQFLRIERDFLITEGGISYLSVGVVYDDKSKGVVLIELPHEADSGANRLWVQRDQVRFPTRKPA
jgi:hypothetical protein